MAVRPAITGNNVQNGLLETVVIGAGPAGLATSFELKCRGINHVVLERGDRPGFVWANLYDSLTLHTGRHMSGLPGMAIPRSVPLFPPRAAFLAYLDAYAATFELPIRLGVDVQSVARDGARWLLRTSHGELCAATVVVATGVVSNPNVPEIDGSAVFQGKLFHASCYRRPTDIAAGRVLIVGCGNSGGEIASELAAVGRQVDIAIRSGANVVPRELMGIPIQYLSYWLLKLPRPVQVAVTAAVGRLVVWRRGAPPFPPANVSPLDAIPLIGFHLADAVKAGKVRVRPALARLTATGAIFSDATEETYKTIIFATGYRAALGPFGDLVRRDAKGFALRTDRVSSADDPSLFMVGHTYDASGALGNIGHDARLAAAHVERFLKPPPRRPATVRVR